MAREIERKFLLKDASWRDLAEGESSIVQFYVLIAADRSLRVRIRDGARASMTLKFGESARERDEFVYPLPLADAEAMRDFAIGRVIEKVRRLAAWRGRVYEIDEFGGDLAGLVVAELENADATPREDLPPWIGREVTDDPRYLNVSLALAAGGPPQ